MGMNGTETLLRHIRNQIAQTLRLFRKFIQSGTDTFLAAHCYGLLILTMLFLKLLIVFPIGINERTHHECQRMWLAVSGASDNGDIYDSRFLPAAFNLDAMGIADCHRYGGKHSWCSIINRECAGGVEFKNNPLHLCRKYMNREVAVSWPCVIHQRTDYWVWSNILFHRLRNYSPLWDGVSYRQW